MSLLGYWERGSGKSTLIDILMGIIKPKIGNVLVDDVDIFNNLDSWFRIWLCAPKPIF